MTLSAQVRLRSAVHSCDLFPVLLGVAEKGAKIEGQIDHDLLASGGFPNHRIPVLADEAPIIFLQSMKHNIIQSRTIEAVQLSSFCNIGLVHFEANAEGCCKQFKR